MMDPQKEMLVNYIYIELQGLLRENGGRMRKDEARRIIEERFKAKHGWNKYFHSVRANAWGWAVRFLERDSVTMPCSGRSFYELRQPGGRGNAE
jgi:hypothetical protein